MFHKKWPLEPKMMHITRKEDFEESTKLIFMIRRGCQDDGSDKVDDVGMTQTLIGILGLDFT